MVDHTAPAQLLLANLLNKLVSDVEIGVGHVTFIEELAQVGGYVREWVDGDFIYFIESL